MSSVSLSWQNNKIFGWANGCFLRLGHMLQALSFVFVVSEKLYFIPRVTDPSVQMVLWPPFDGSLCLLIVNYRTNEVMRPKLVAGQQFWFSRYLTRARSNGLLLSQIHHPTKGFIQSFTFSPVETLFLCHSDSVSGMDALNASNVWWCGNPR